MKTKGFNTPILFIIFRRKETAMKVIDAIAKVKPAKLYISQDGPRNEKEKKEVLETRKAVLSRINWDCEITVWTHDKNLGCKKHIPGAFDKFFEKEEMGIYLEDDTLPSKEFFYFEQELLERYKDDKRIFSINGTNFYPEKTKMRYSYCLTEICSIWGMGIWKRSWKLYDSEIKNFSIASKSEMYNNYFFSRKFKFYMETFWNSIKRGRLDAWDAQNVFAAVNNNMFFILPSVNLVNNLGINRKASNLSIQKYYHNYNDPFPLKHPQHLVYNRNIDAIYFGHVLKGGWLRLFAIRFYLSLPLWIGKMIIFKK